VNFKAHCYWCSFAVTAKSATKKNEK